jgi:hypothetical protein
MARSFQVAVGGSSEDPLSKALLAMSNSFQTSIDREEQKEERKVQMAREDARLAMADKRYEEEKIRQRQQDNENTKRWEAGHQLALDAAGRQASDQNWQEFTRGKERKEIENRENLDANYDSIVYGGLQKADDILANTKMLGLTTSINEALEKKDVTDPIYQGVSKQIQQADQAVRTAVGKDSIFQGLKDEDISRLAVVGNGQASDNLGSVTIGEGDKARTFTGEDRLRLGDIVERARSAAAPDIFGGKEALGRLMSSTRAGLTTGTVTLDEYKNAARLATTQALEESGIKPTEENRAKVEALILKEKGNAGFKTAAELLASKDKKIEEQRKVLDDSLDVYRAFGRIDKDGKYLDANGAPVTNLSKLDQAVSPEAYGHEYMRELKLNNANTFMFTDSDVTNMNQRLAGLYGKLKEEQKAGTLDPRAAALAIQDAINRLNTSGEGLSWSDWQWMDSPSSATSTSGVAKTGKEDYDRYVQMIKSGKTGTDKRLLLSDAADKVQNAQEELDRLKAAEAAPGFDTKAVTKEYFRLPK